MAGRSAAAVITRYAGLQVQTSALGVNIPVGWGTFRCKCNLVDYLDFKSVAQKAAASGKGGSTVTGYSYSASVILAVCEGPIDGISIIYVNGKVLTDGTTTALTQAGLSLSTGAVGQSPWPYLTTNHPDHAIGYSGLAICHAANYPLDSGATTPNHSFEVQRLTSFGVSGTKDADPSRVVADFFGNGRYGVPGWAAGLLDTASLTTAAGSYQAYCLAAGLLVSPVIDQQTSASAFLTELFKATNSTCVWSEGVLKFIPYGDTALSGNGKTYTPNLTPVYALDDDAFVPGEDGKAPVQADIQDQSDAWNVVQLEYLDRTNQYNMGIALASDAANVAQYGMRRKDPDTVHCICDPAVAAISAQLYLQRTLYVRAQYRFTLGWMYALLEPGDIVEITDAGLGLSAYPVRIIQIDEDEKYRLAVIAEDFPVGVSHTPLYAMQTGQGTQANHGVDPGGVEANLLLRSADFTSTAWTAFDLAITAGAAANPLTGAADAQKLTPTTAGAVHDVSQSLAAFSGANYTFQVYLKAAGYAGAILTLDDAGGADQASVQVDLSAAAITGTGTGGSGRLVDCGISSLGSGWCLVWLTAQIAATTITAQINVADNSGAASFAGDGASGLYAFGAQVYQGLAGRPYASTTTAAAGPLIFNPPSVITRGGLETWAAVAGGPDWAGAYVWVSLDGGSTYEQVTDAGGYLAAGAARFGALTATFAVGADPDTANTCSVDLGPSGGELTAAADAVADGAGTLCLVDNELISFSGATLTAANRYDLAGYIRRGVEGTAIASHSAGAPFVRLDGAPIVLPWLPSQAGLSAFVKFQSFNAWGHAQSLADCVAYPITPATNPAGTSPNGNTAYGGELVATANQTFLGGTDPAMLGSVLDGAFWFDNATGVFYQRHGGAWIGINTPADGSILYAGAASSWSYSFPSTALPYATIYLWGGGGGGRGAVSPHAGGGGGFTSMHSAVTPGSTTWSGACGGGGLGGFHPPDTIFNAGGNTTCTQLSLTAYGGAAAAAGSAGSGGGYSGGTGANGSAGDTAGAGYGGASAGSGGGYSGSSASAPNGPSPGLGGGGWASTTSYSDGANGLVVIVAHSS
jgi:hypothetical protein